MLIYDTLQQFFPYLIGIGLRKKPPQEKRKI